jgi:branched-chain amino acid transport system permease protein
VLLALGGCADRAGQQARICETALMGLLPAGQPLEDVAVSATFGDPPRTVMLTYKTGRFPAREGWILCGFETGEGVFAPPELVRVTTSSEGTLGAAALFFLKNYWLDRATGPSGPSLGPWTPTRYALQQLVNAITPACVYAILAIGISLVHAHVGRIHLALGDIGMIGSYAAVGVLVLLAAGTSEARLQMAALAAMTTALLVSACWAGVSARGGFGQLWRSAGTGPLIAMVGLSIALREAVRIGQSAREPWLPPLLPPPVPLDFLGLPPVALRPSALVSLGALLLLWGWLLLLLRRTGFGREVRAAADDAAMAALLGIDVDRLRWQLFALAGLCAGLAGTLVLLVYGTLGIEGGFILALKGLAAAVVGGIGSVSGAVLGAALIGIAETLWAAYVGGAFRDVAVFTILILVLVLRPEGLIPRPELHPNDRFRPI